MNDACVETLAFYLFGLQTYMKVSASVPFVWTRIENFKDKSLNTYQLYINPDLECIV